MPSTVSPNRRARFRAALALAGSTMAKWAAEHDVSQGHVSQVAGGLRSHPELESEMDRFIESHLPTTAAA